MPFSIIPFVLLVIPILEIGVFVVVGREIGFLATIGLVIFTAIIGSILLRWQGFQVFVKLQAELEAGQVPGREIVHGAMILVAGALLLTPGFVTDTIGFLLFVPGIRDVIWSAISSKISMTGSQGFGSTFHRKSTNDGKTGFGSRSNEDDIIDLGPDEFSTMPDSDSPWRPAEEKTDKKKLSDDR